GDDAHQPRFVRTAHRIGYAFCADALEARDKQPGTTPLQTAAWLVRGRQKVALELGETIIGRDPGADIQLDDPSVSRRHARIVVSETGATVEDLGSKNGTHLGDTPVRAPLPLSDGDTVRIGSVPFTVRLFQTPASTVTSVDQKR